MILQKCLVFDIVRNIQRRNRDIENEKISTYYEDTELKSLGLLLFYFCSMLTDLQYRNELMEMEVEHYLELPLPHTRTLSLSLS